MVDLYVLLKISPDSSQEEVEAAYQRFTSGVGRFAPGLCVTEIDFEKVFPEICNAFRILRDTRQRTIYDNSIHSHEENLKSLSLSTAVHVPEEKLTFRQWLNQAATYTAFIVLMVMVILFLYMLADYSL